MFIIECGGERDCFQIEEYRVGTLVFRLGLHDGDFLNSIPRSLYTING